MFDVDVDHARNRSKDGGPNAISHAGPAIGAGELRPGVGRRLEVLAQKLHHQGEQVHPAARARDAVRLVRIEPELELLVRLFEPLH